MIGEAVRAMFSLGWAALAWLFAAATAGTLLVWSAVFAAGWTWRTVRRSTARS